MNWIGMEGEYKRENDKCSLEENVLNGRLEIWSRNMQIDGKMKELIMENDVNEMIRRREDD